MKKCGIKGKMDVLVTAGIAVIMVLSGCGGTVGTITMKTMYSPPTLNGDKDTKITIDYEFQLPSLNTTALGTAISIPGLNSVGQSGAPELPVKTAKILIPEGMSVHAIEAHPGEELVIPGTYTIRQAQKPVPLSDTRPIALTEPDPAIYESSEPYPHTYSDTVSTQALQGYSLIIINLYPIHYTPKTGTLTYAPKLVLTIHLKPEETMKNSVLPRRNLPQDDTQITAMVDNPETLATYTREPQRYEPLLKGKGGLVDPADTYTYVIITNQTLRDATGEYTFQDLMASKIAKGISATIVTVEDIYANYQGRDHQEQIRDFIRDAYENWETRYVLLGGDGDGANVGGESENAIVPTRGLYAPIYPVLDPDGGDVIAADLYYACLDGSYDSNNNNIFGEIGDGYDIHEDGEVDLFAEVYVGRAPVDSATELSNFVRKTLAYENTDDTYLENVRMVGELLFDFILGLELKVFATPAKDEIKDGTYTTAGIPREQYNVSTLYDDEGSLQQENIDISAYTGVSDHVRIGFRLQSDQYLNYSGFYIDDVNVTGDGAPLFSDDMEHGENRWTHSGAGDEWELGIPFTGALQAHSGIYCWGTDLDGSYENLCNQRLVSPSIDLSSVSTAALSFYCWSYTEEGYDYGYVELSTDDGQSWTTLKNYTGGWTEDDLTAIINDGVHVINHLGHCNNFHLMRLDDPVSMRNMVISGPSHDIQNLTNEHPFFVYSQGCYPGAFDNRAPGPPVYQNPGYYPYDCIGEHLVTSVHGAFACVLNSRYGLGAADPRQGQSQYFDREFFDALYGENKRNLGIANQDSKEDNIGFLGLDGIRYCYYGLNLLGDPEVAIKDPVPREHDIAVTKLNAMGYMKVHTSNSINVTIYNAGQNLEADISVQFCVNGQLVEEQVISSLAVGQSIIIEFDWVPPAEGTYLLGITVSPVDGETMLYNNQMGQIVHVFSEDAVYVCVLDSFATGLGHGICDTLNREWRTYGSIPIVIDYRTFGEGGVTYQRLVEAGPDVIVVSMIFPMLGGHEFSCGEIAAITRYVKEGHGFIAINNPFYYGAGQGYGFDNRELLPLFGLRDDLELYTLGGLAGNLAILAPDHPLFRNVPNPYSVGEPDCSVPHGYGSWWSADDLSGGTFVAQSGNSQGVIVVNRGLVYISNAIDFGPNASDLQFMYNAMLWSRYNLPPAAPTGVTALPGDIFVNLYWSSNSEDDIDYYSIYRSIVPDTGFEKIVQVDGAATFYQDTERFMGTAYYYKITATDKGYSESNFSSTVSATPRRPIRGDANNDGLVNVADIVYLINYLFVHGPAPLFLASADVNNDGTFEEPRVDIVDVVYLINYLFVNGPPPVYLNWPNYPPRARVGDNQTCLTGYTVYFDGSSSYDLDGTIISYRWDFGDNTTSYDITTTHQYTTNGTFTVTLTVTDNENGTDTDTCFVRVFPRILYVPEDYPTIQDAINAAINGQTILVAPGTYIENINFLGKAITVKSTDGPGTTIIDGRYFMSVVTFNNSEASTSILEGFTLINGDAYWGAGVRCIGSSPTIKNNSITQDCVSNKGWGIYLVDATNTTIYGNTITNNYDAALYLCNSAKNIITANNVSNALWLQGSPTNTITTNSFGSGGITITGDEPSHWNTQIIENNAVNGKPIYYYKNNDIGGDVASDAAQIILVQCSNFTLQNLTITNVTRGIQLAYSMDNTISMNTIAANEYGIFVECSSENTIANNTIINNHDGICLENSCTTTISGNTITHNTDNGVILAGSSTSIISENTITDHNYGINLYISSNNEITHNLLKNNSQSGISVDFKSSNNHLYHNNFINNTQEDAYDQGSHTSWDNGYPDGGNYWDDFDEPGEGAYDNFSGPDQNISGNDGIVDTPYPLSDTARDRYPLVIPQWPDKLAPAILDVEAIRTVQLHGRNVNITCKVTDDTVIDTVNVTIDGPPGFTPINITMNRMVRTDNYYYESSYTVIGTYDYYIWAIDKCGNSIVSEIQHFEIPAPPTIDYILITKNPDSSEIHDKTVGTEYTVTGYTSAYNNTFGYIGLASVNWSIENIGSDASTDPLNGTSSTFTAGTQNNTVAIWRADDGNGHNDTIVFTIRNVPIYVDDDAPQEWYNDAHVKTITEAVEIVAKGETVFVFNGTYVENVVIDKTIRLIGQDEKSTIIDGGKIENVVCVAADQVNITGFTIRNSKPASGWHWYAGIKIKAGVDSTAIYGNTIANNYDGIWLEWSSNSTIITSNTIINNSGCGINLVFSSDATVSSNFIDNSSYGINLALSSDTTISSNFIDNSSYGIYPVQSMNNTIFNNTLVSNAFGILMYDSSGNILSGNTFMNNECGIYMDLNWSSNNNILYHNTFINAANNAYDECSNTWYNTTLHQGNYWSDYQLQHPDAVDADGDGCWDTPYDISGKTPPNQDLYPLVNLWTPPLDTLPDLIISDFSVAQLSETAFQLTATIKNIGDGITNQPFQVSFNIIESSLGSITFASLKPGETTEATILWKTQLKGNTPITAYVDSTHVIKETDETNNQASLTITISLLKENLKNTADVYKRLSEPYKTPSVEKITEITQKALETGAIPILSSI
jgi:parallel beta-helix repeat protein